MIYMSSSSSSSGQYTLTVTFEVGTDVDMATVLVQNRVNIAQGNLPEAVIQQGIVTKKQSYEYRNVLVSAIWITRCMTGYIFQIMRALI